MTFSIVIPTFNAGDRFDLLLKQIHSQDIQPSEIIVIDSSSTDKTPELAKKHQCILRTIPQEEFDHANTRTMALESVQSSIVIFITQDVFLYDETSFSKLLEPFADTTIGAVYGRQLPFEEGTLFAKHLRYFNYGTESYTRTFKDIQSYGIKTAFLSNSFCAYRLEALKQIGYFKKDLILGEDMVAGAMLLESGYSLFYQAESKVYHSHSYSMIQEFRRYFDIGVLHSKESWLIEKFGKAEREGFRFLISEWKFLIDEKRHFFLFFSFLRTIFKYSGYKLGRIHHIFPISISEKLSMHPKWWNKLNSKK